MSHFENVGYYTFFTPDRRCITLPANEIENVYFSTATRLRNKETGNLDNAYFPLGSLDGFKTKKGDLYYATEENATGKFIGYCLDGDRTKVVTYPINDCTQAICLFFTTDKDKGDVFGAGIFTTGNDSNKNNIANFSVSDVSKPVELDLLKQQAQNNDVLLLENLDYTLRDEADGVITQGSYTSAFFDIKTLDVPVGMTVNYLEGGKLPDEQIKNSVSQLNTLITKNNSGYAYNTDMSRSDLGKISVGEVLHLNDDNLYKLDHRLMYLSEYSIEKGNPINLYVVYTKVDFLVSGNWNEYAKQVYEASNLKNTNAILITVPYFDAKNREGITDFSVSHYMPGVYAKGIDINTAAIGKIKAVSSRMESTGVVQYESITSTQVEDFITKVYTQTYKPYVIYFGLRYADGTIQVKSEDSGKESKPGYGFVKTIILKSNKYFDDIKKLTLPERGATQTLQTGTSVYTENPNYESERLLYDLQRAELIDRANQGNASDWKEVENSIQFKEKQLDELTANKYITGYAFKDDFEQWINDLNVVFGGTENQPPKYTFDQTYNKDTWSTVDPVVYGTIDVASLLASVWSADAVPEAIGLMYATKRGNAVNMALYSSTIILPVVASGELRAGALASQLTKDSKIFYRGFVHTLNADGKLAKVSTTYTRGRLLEFFKFSDNAPITITELDAFAEAVKGKKITNSQIKSILSEVDETKRVAFFKEVVNGGGLTKASQFLSKHPQIMQDDAILNATARLLKNNSAFVEANSTKISTIIDKMAEAGIRCRTCATTGSNAGLKYFDEVLDDLDFAITNYSKTPGFDKLLTEMAAHANKADGGAFALQYLRSQGTGFASKVQEFESFYLSGARFEADIKIKDGVEKLLELKSWSKSTWETFGSGSSLEQLKGYIESYKKDKNLFEYIANKTKLVNDGVADPIGFVKGKFQNAFKNNAKELFEKNPRLFEKITYNGNKIDIDDYQELIEYCNKSDFYNSSLFNFIKLE
ncbi:MAG: hypothetical protein LBO74_10735 [Candidatus Symbiothrix sp.]|nr:hypothetical protein [Candidatus Symbiothrix sp.]